MIPMLRSRPRRLRELPVGDALTDANAPAGVPRTVPGMPKPSYTPINPLRARAVPIEREQRRRAPTKSISRIDVAVVAPLAADRAVLVDLHDDFRLSLGALAKDLGVSFTTSWSVVEIATGHIVLAAEATESIGAELTLDGRQRLRLPLPILHRLGVGVGSQVLVSASPDGTELRLLNLGALADLLAPATEEVPQEVH